jgi:hypothetical protein
MTAAPLSNTCYPAEIRRWHGWDYIEHGGLDEIEVIYFQGVTADESAGTIAIADGSRFELEDRGGETMVRVTMPAPGANWAKHYDSGCAAGWALACGAHRGQSADLPRLPHGAT